MTKTEFVERLCSALSRSGVTALVEKNRLYYTEYIEGEIAKGRTEEEVLAELGEPELIANSILEANGLRDKFVDDDTKTYNAYDTPDGDPTTFAQGFEYKGKENERTQNGYSQDGRSQNQGTQGNRNQSGVVGEEPDAGKKGMSPKTKVILILIAAALILIGIIVLLVLAVGGIFALLGPILIPILVIWLIFKLIKSLSGK